MQRDNVVSLNSLKRVKKMVLVIEDRTVALLFHNNQVYCIDEFCYHHGGPLSHGDIEDVHEHSCIVCPWHHYKISLNSGEGLYLGLDGKLRTKGIKQRVHQVIVDESNDTVQVVLNKDETVIESDRYVGLNCKSERQQKQPSEVVNLRELKRARALKREQEGAMLEKKEIDKTINPHNPKSESNASNSRFY